MIQKTFHTKFGFTLVEVIVIVALSTIIMLAISESMVSFYKFNGYTIAQSYQVTNARQGIEQLVRDLREMTFADNGTFPLAVMEPTRVGFFSDIDRDDSVEYIEYRLATTTLGSTTLEKRMFNATGSPPSYGASPDSVTIISEYVQNSLQNLPIFVYYDGEGNPATGTSTVTDIRYIETSLIINIDPVRDPGEFMLRSSTSLRNLKNSQ